MHSRQEHSIGPPRGDCQRHGEPVEAASPAVRLAARDGSIPASEKGQTDNPSPWRRSIFDAFIQNGLSRLPGKWLSIRPRGAPEPNTASSAPAAKSSATPPLNADRLKVLHQLGPGAVPRLARIFLDSTAGEVERIHAGAADSDHTALLAAAHSLKGSSATLGATGLQAQCAEVEAHAKSGTGIERHLVEAVDQEYTKVRAALLELLGTVSVAS